MTQYLDLAGPAPHVGFPGPPVRANRRMEVTAAGFLLCRDVPLSRTGEQQYMAHEITSLEPDRSGMVTAVRDDEEVFHPDSIASFVGVPLTNDHPTDDVTPGNWQSHTVGTVLNARRGEGDAAHCVVGDVIVYHPDTIAAIRSGKRQVSVGYDADYEKLAPGRGRQKNIRANHLSLVREGRCGPACAISDRKVEMSTAAASKVGTQGWFRDMAKKLRGVRDEDFEKELEANAAVLPVDADAPDRPPTDTDKHITVNITTNRGTGTDDGVQDDAVDPPAGGDMDPDAITAAVTAAMAPLSAKIDALGTRMDGFESALEDVSDPDPTDSRTSDAVARAAVLVPGYKPPTFDAAPGTAKQRDAVVNLQRSVLTAAMQNPAAHAVVRRFVDSARPDFAKMPAEAVRVIFVAASDALMAANNAATADVVHRAYVRDEKTGDKKVLDGRSWNQMNEEAWARRRSA